jgi:hypothetical protein
MHSRILTVTLAASAVLTLTGVATPASATSGRASPSPSPSPSLEGVWLMDGYGTAVAVSGRRLTTYDTTAVSCLPGTMKGEQRGRTAPDGSRRFPVFGGAVDVTVTPRGDDTARLRIASSAGTRTLHRIAALPDRCAEKPAADPREVFDVFWRTYAENYPFFAAKHIDWQAVRDRYRPRVGKDTTDDELFAVLREMIEPLHDAHTSLSDGKDREFGGLRPDTPPHGPEDLARIDTAVAKAVGVPLREYANGALSFARLPEGTGYLRVTRFVGYTEEESYAKWEAELDAALDSIPWRKLTGLVVDVRLNGGGADPLALRVVSRLTDRPYTAYTKYARNDPRDPTRFTPGQPITVRPPPPGQMSNSSSPGLRESQQAQEAQQAEGAGVEAEDEGRFPVAVQPGGDEWGEAAAEGVGEDEGRGGSGVAQPGREQLREEGRHRGEHQREEHQADRVGAGDHQAVA